MKRIMFLGHSVLAFYKEDQIGEWQIDNISRQGIITKEGLQILQDNVELARKAQAILVMFGINELYYQMKEESITTNLEQLILQLKEINGQAKVILSLIMQTPETTRLKPDKIDRVNQVIKKLSLTYQTELFDWQPLYDQEGKVAASNSLDGIHLSGQGYQVFNQQLIEILENLS